MCLIAFAIGQRPDLPLLVAANRDELWSRPTLALQAWALPSGKTAYAGRDAQAGGTWLGLAEDGRIAMLTNVRAGPPEPAPRSRGELVLQWLDAETRRDAWLRRFDPAQYGGFNLVLGDLRSGHWTWLSNRPPSSPSQEGRDANALGDRDLPPGWHGHDLKPGLYGLSNAGLDTPWPKTLALKRALREHLSAGAPLNAVDPLLHALLCMSPVADAQLPQTGVSLEVERRLSSPFVHAPEIGYGTRSSLLVHGQGDGRLVLREWTHAPQRLGLNDRRPRHWPLRHSELRQLELPALAPARLFD